MEVLQTIVIRRGVRHEVETGRFCIAPCAILYLLCGFLLTAIATTFGTYTIWQRK